MDYINNILDSITWVHFLVLLIFVLLYEYVKVSNKDSKMKERIDQLENEKSNLRNYINLKGYKPDFEYIEQDPENSYSTRWIKKLIDDKYNQINESCKKLNLEFKEEDFIFYLLEDGKEIARSYGLDVILHEINNRLKK